MATPQTALAIETLDRMAVQFQGIKEAADLLRTIGSTEGVLEDLAKQRDDLSKQVFAAMDQLAKALNDLDSAKNDAALILQQAKDDAEQIRADAFLDSEKVKKDAADAAQATLANEQAQREANLSTINDKIIDAQSKLADLNAKISSLTVQAQEAEMRAVKAQDSLDKVRAAAAKLAG